MFFTMFLLMSNILTNFEEPMFNTKPTFRTLFLVHEVCPDFEESKYDTKTTFREKKFMERKIFLLFGYLS